MRFPVLTVILIAINIGVFIWQWQFPTSNELKRVGLESGIDQSSARYGAIPYRLTHPGESECAIAAVKQEGGGRAAEIACQGTPELAEAEAFAAEIACQGTPSWRRPRPSLCARRVREWMRSRFPSISPCGG